MYFLHSGFLSNLRLPWKQSCLGIFHCIAYTFYIQDFWATCACPEKQNCPEIFHCVEKYFIIQDFWATSACPEKRSCPGIFHCIEYVFFIIQDFWAISACPENSFPWNFSIPPSRTPMILRSVVVLQCTLLVCDIEKSAVDNTSWQIGNSRLRHQNLLEVVWSNATIWHKSAFKNNISGYWACYKLPSTMSKFCREVSHYIASYLNRLTKSR